MHAWRDTVAFMHNTRLSTRPVYTRVHPKPLQKAEAEAEAEAEAQAEPERHACMAGVVTCIYAQCFGSLL